MLFNPIERRQDLSFTQCIRLGARSLIALAACISCNAFGCTVIGDSIAVGTANSLKQCKLIGIGGINSWQWNKHYNPGAIRDDTVVISLGSNDHKYIRTQQELIKVRKSVLANHVKWILPAGNLKASEVNISEVRTIINSIAGTYGDQVISIHYVSTDGIHPTGKGYQDIAVQIFN